MHIDPATARSTGLERPILHGLSTMGLIGRALIHACAGGEAARLTSIALRFTAPVYPGDTICTHIWQDGETLQFRSTAVETGLVVADNGTATLATTGSPAA